jgi:hypothetical protein
MVAWLLSRGLLVWLLLGPQEWVRGDVSYFGESLDLLAQRGLAGTLVEYPLPAVAVVAVPWGVGELLGLEGGYPYLVMAAAGLTDLAFLLLLRHVSRGLAAPVAWLLAVPLLGATAFARFDLLPGVLCGAALLLLASRPRVAAACVAVATAVKLWPALVIPAMAASSRSRRDLLVVVAAVGVVLAAASALAAGWGRLVSPLTYQADRGLQVEAVVATPAVVGSWMDPTRWPVHYAPSRAYEITGPGVDVLLGLSTLLTLGYVAALLGAWWRAWVLRDRLSAGTTVWLSLAAVTGFLVVGKVLSPQYLLWLLPMAVAGLAVCSSRTLGSWTAALLVAAGLTQVVFPGFYEHLVLAGDRMWLPTLAVVARNALLTVLLAVAAREVWRGLRADAQRGIELERQPPGPERSAGRTSR